MESSTFSNNRILGLFVLIAIGLLSLAVTFTRMPANQVIINRDTVKSSSLDVSLYDNAGDVLFSTSPLNDYFYANNVKYHFEDKIVSSNNGGLAQTLWLSLKNLIFNKKELMWDVIGSNSFGKISISYALSQVRGGVEIKRAFSSKMNAENLGQVIEFCPDCLVTDDKNRVYFNADTVRQFDIDTAARLNLTPLVIGENQFFPQNASLIKIIDRNNKLKMRIPVKSAQVFLQYQWRLLEFKIKFNKGETSISQEILLDE